MNELTKTNGNIKLIGEWYGRLVDDCKTIITERQFRANMEAIECWHEVGKRIVDDKEYQKFSKGNSSAVKELGKDLNVGKTTIYQAISFYSKYPDLSNALETLGKDVSWYKIANGLYVEKKDKQKLAVPKGKYSCMVIDPPWPIEKIEREVRPKQKDMDYEVMCEDELLAFNIPSDSSFDDCHLFLWTTHKWMPFSFRLINIWGFRYVCCFVWHKPGGFQPYGLPQYNCEFVLYARKGSPEFIDTKAFNTCFTAPRGNHSEKPEEFYDLLRRVTAEPRIDIFNRRKIEGFDTYGYEAK